MSGRYLTDLAGVLRAAGQAVVELDGWATRARSSGGYQDGGPWCVMVHHTASGGDGASDAQYCTFGSPDRPVCNLVLGRDAVWYVCAAGATNTNGKGGPWRLANGRTVAQDQMNLRAIGIELSNNGVGQTFPAVQMDALFAGLVALAGAYLGGDVTLVCHHQAWAPTRKIDPATAAAVLGPWRPRATTSSGTWSLDDLIVEAQRRAFTPTPTPPPLFLEEDDVRLFTCPGDPARPAVLLAGGWRKIARTDEEAAVFANCYGPAVEIDARNYDVISSLAAQGSDGWP